MHLVSTPDPNPGRAPQLEVNVSPRIPCSSVAHIGRQGIPRSSMCCLRKGHSRMIAWLNGCQPVASS